MIVKSQCELALRLRQMALKLNVCAAISDHFGFQVGHNNKANDVVLD